MKAAERGKNVQESQLAFWSYKGYDKGVVYSLHKWRGQKCLRQGRNDDREDI